MEKPYVPRKEQARLTKKKIFDTTIRLIHKKGYSKITIREICQNAQISVGTFYLYFSSKDDILLEIYYETDRKTVFPAMPVDMGIIDHSEFICKCFSIYLGNMIKEQEKELLCEIYRNSLATGNNQFLNPDRPLYRTILSILDSAAQDKKLHPSHSSSAVCRKLFVFVQSYIFQWLTSSEITSSDLTEICITDLKLYLTLYLQEGSCTKY